MKTPCFMAGRSECYREDEALPVKFLRRDDGCNKDADRSTRSGDGRPKVEQRGGAGCMICPHGTPRGKQEWNYLQNGERGQPAWACFAEGGVPTMLCCVGERGRCSGKRGRMGWPVRARIGVMVAVVATAVVVRARGNGGRCGGEKAGGCGGVAARGQYDLARQELDEFFKMYPQDARATQARYERGICEFNLNDSAGAVRDLARRPGSRGLRRVTRRCRCSGRFTCNKGSWTRRSRRWMSW